MLQLPKPAPVVPRAPASRGRLRCGGGLTAPYYSHRWPGHPSTHPHPLLFCGDGSLTPQRTSEPSYSSTHGHPLPRLPRLHVVPFLGLAVVHRPGASARGCRHGQRKTSIGSGLYVERLTAGSTAAARKCLLITRKVMIPPPDSREPPDGPPVFCEKNRFPLTAGTHQLHLAPSSPRPAVLPRRPHHPTVLPSLA